MKRHIFLTGFMGAGKSRIGRKLAASYDWPFIDTDKQIEEKTGKKVKDLFEEDGEKHFRALETATINELAENKLPAIIALGGGALQSDANYQVISGNGMLIYIKSSPEAILERVKQNKKRPLLKIEDGPRYEERLLEKIMEIMSGREPMYQRADLVFDRDQMELGQIVQYLKLEIERLWKEVNENY